VEQILDFLHIVKYLNKEKVSIGINGIGLDSRRYKLLRGQKEGDKQKWEVGGKREKAGESGNE